MKKNISRFVLPIFLVSGIVIITAFSYSSVPKSMTLEEAIKTKTVTANFKSTGKYSGNCVTVNLTNNSSQAIRIIVAAGTKYSPTDKGEQTLIQVEDAFIALNSKGGYNGRIAAFCTEASDRCPSENSNFTLSRNTDPKFNRLFAYTKGKSIDKSTFQDAVWAISDNYSVSNIVVTDAIGKAFRTEVADISGQKDTWFTSPQQVQVDEQGNINTETLNINGRLEFDCRKGAKVQQDIHKENGEVFFASNRVMTSQTNHITYTFHLAVRGWEKGKYYINIRDGETSLAKYEFSI